MVIEVLIFVIGIDQIQAEQQDNELEPKYNAVYTGTVHNNKMQCGNGGEQ
jgi:hypothetical protein